MESITVAKHISFYLTYVDLCRLSTVSRYWNIFWSSDAFWSSLDDFDDLEPENIKQQYKRCLESCFVMTEAKRKVCPECPNIKSNAKLLEFRYKSDKSIYFVSA